MGGYYKCSNCGANLDAGEVCDCDEEHIIAKQLMELRRKRIQQLHEESEGKRHGELMGN